jgi:hypothetical protein
MRDFCLACHVLEAGPGVTNPLHPRITPEKWGTYAQAHENVGQLNRIRPQMSHAFRGTEADREALALFEQALRNRMETLGPAHPQTLQTRVQLARTHGMLANHASAAHHAEAALGSAASNPEASRAVLAEADLVLAEVALAEGRAAGARTLLDRARARLAAGPPPGDLARDLDRLAARLESR